MGTSEPLVGPLRPRWAMSEAQVGPTEAGVLNWQEFLPRGLKMKAFILTQIQTPKIQMDGQKLGSMSIPKMAQNSSEWLRTIKFWKF